MADRVATALAQPRVRLSFFLGLTAFAVSAPFVQLYSAQPASRYSFTAAMVDHGTVELDRYEHVLGVDRARHDGHTYSDKAPGQPLIATAPYAAYRMAGGEPATVYRFRENLGVWWITLWCSVLPFVAVVVMMWHLALRTQPVTALAAAIALGFGTLLLPFSTYLYGEVAVAALLLGTWLLADVPSPHPRRLVAAGLLGGLAIAVEYQAALGVAVIGLYTLARHRYRASWMLAAAIPSVAGLLAYHWLVFDHPLRTSIRTKAGPGAGLYKVGMPDLAQIGEILFTPRGLASTPVALLAIAGLVVVWRRAGSAGRTALAAGTVFGAFLLLQAAWPNPWGGEMPGPRYLIPALPFLAVGAAEAFRRWWAVSVAFTVIAVVVSLLPTITDHVVGFDGGPIPTYLSRLDRGEITPTIFTMALGGAGWVLHGLIVAGAAWGLWRSWVAHQELEREPPTR